MPNWITHAIIADKLFQTDLKLDKNAFVIGSVAPDCNIENEDWSAFTPPRETTHFMKNNNKETADFEGFYKKYILNKTSLPEEEKSYFLGYYAHLISDARFQAFIREESRVSACFFRLSQYPEIRIKLEGKPINWDTIKEIFPKQVRYRDIVDHENEYIINNPNSCYNTILLTTDDYYDFTGILPTDGIKRKLPIMAPRNKSYQFSNQPHLFVTAEEYEHYLDSTSAFIYGKIKKAR